MLTIVDFIRGSSGLIKSGFRLNTSRCLIVTLSLTGCTTPPPPEKELANQKFSSIALISPADILSVTTADPRSDKLKQGVGTGVTSGSLGGMLVGAAACGPYLYGLCVIGIGAAGFIAGGASGAIYGFSGLSDSSARELEGRIEDINLENDLQTQLVEHVKELVPNEVLSEPALAEIQAIVAIEKIQFLKSAGEVHLEILVRLTFATRESRRVPELGSRDFTAHSKGDDIDHWLEAESSKLESVVAGILDEIARNMAEALVSHWSPAAAASLHDVVFHSKEA
jgi:uncharacterized membrane protein